MTNALLKGVEGVFIPVKDPANSAIWYEGYSWIQTNLYRRKGCSNEDWRTLSDGSMPG